MQFDDLKTAWKREMSSQTLSSDQLQDIRRHMAGFDRRLIGRDLRETLVCILMFGFFGYILITGDRGTVVIMASCMLITGVLLYARRGVGGDDWSLRARIDWEIRKLERQKRLLTQVTWWYLLPLSVGIVLFTIGVRLDADGTVGLDGALVAVYLGVLVMGVAVYKLNQWAVRREIQPPLERLRKLRCSLSEDGGA